MHYFIRANGDTSHNNPGRPSHYVPGEPPTFPATHFNYVRFCVDHGIARLGWPDTGDLRAGSKVRALASGYDITTVRPHVQTYLDTFREIAPGEVVLLPDPTGKGVIHAGSVIDGYYYHHNVPNEPYECAHRVTVAWDRASMGQWIVYTAEELGIGIRGGFWTRAFQVIENAEEGAAIIERLRRLRNERRAG